MKCFLIPIFVCSMRSEQYFRRVQLLHHRLHELYSTLLTFYIKVEHVELPVIVECFCDDPSITIAVAYNCLTHHLKEFSIFISDVAVGAVRCFTELDSHDPVKVTKTVACIWWTPYNNIILQKK